MKIDVKICGVRDEIALRAAEDSGATYIGFVFYARSKNTIDIKDAHHLIGKLSPSVQAVGLFVDPSNDELISTLGRVPLALLQLHGSETPERLTEIKSLTGLPVMKALKVKTEDQMKSIEPFERVADKLLFDSRLGKEASGGPLDWQLLAHRKFSKPWMLAGGLTPDNVIEAIHRSGATGVDVSSGVEEAPGVKSATKIRAFIAAVARA